MRRVALGLVLVTALAVPAMAQNTEPLFNGRDLNGWKAEHAKVRVRDGAVHVEPSQGWVRTVATYADFVLSFEMRMRAGGGKAGVFVRGWPVFDKDSRPINAFRLTKTFPPSGGADTAWERWDIECVGRALQMRVNGVAAYSVDGIRNPEGYLALWASDGTAEFRAIEFRRVDPPAGDPAAVFTPGTPGAVIPRLLKEVKPSYTLGALTRKIEGSVVISAIVEADGSIGTLSVMQSLDPQYGLDASALDAAKQWRFTPPMLDGKPIRMRIAIDLKFTLK